MKLNLHDGILNHRNALNFIRLCLAIMVIFGHSFQVVVARHSRWEGFAGLAVDLFFMISGFLILASAQRNCVLGYLWRRVLRIFPGYWVALMFVAFVCAPLGSLLGYATHPWTLSEALGFMVRNFDLMGIQYELLGPINVPNPDAWNESIWTLGYEFLAYLLLIPIAYLPVIRRYPRTVVTVAFLVSLMMFPVLELADATTNRYYVYARLFPCFLAGCLLFVWGKKIPVRPLWVTVCLVLSLVIYLGLDSLVIRQFTQLIFAYAILGLACILKIYWGSRNDLSYGVYIYAFPLQQLLVMMGAAPLGIVGNTLIATVLSLGMAYLSWRFVEKPALAWKRIIN